VQLEGGYARVEDFRWEVAGNPVYVTGAASVAGAAQTLDLSIVGALDLRMLSAFVEGIATGGTARTDVWVTGPLAAPVIVGRTAIAEGELRVETPPLAASDLEGTIAISEDRTLTLALEGLANGGAVRLTGNVDLKDVAAPSGQASLSADNLVLEYPDGFQTESEVELTLSLTPPSGAVLSGTIDVLAGTYREPLLVTQGLLAGLGQGMPTGSSASSWLSTLRLDVTVTTTDDLRIDNNYGRLSATANLRLTGTAARPGMIGRIEAAPDGEIFLAGNTFRIETLIVDLADPRAIAPNVTFLAETRVGNTAIEVALECRAAGPCERDVRSLTTGTTNGEAEAMLFGAPEDAADAGERLAQLLSGEILGVVGRTVGLDTLRLESGSGAADIFNDPTLVAGDIDPASRLTLGKRLGRNVELVFSQNLAESGFTWSTTYFGGLGTSYRALLLDDQSRSYEFRHEPRFGSTGRERTPRPPGPRVSAVRIGGTPGFPEDELRSRLSLREGDRFEFTAWQTDRDRLADFYQTKGFLEARIRARRETGEDDTLVLDYTIERGAATSIVFSGADLPSDVRDRIAARWTTTVFDAFLERDARLIVRDHLFGQGHLQATVDASMSIDPAGAVKTLHVNVDPGPILARRLEFEGDEAIPRERLTETATAIGELTAWLDPSAFEEAFRRFYGQEGFLGAEVAVHPPAVGNGESTVRVEISEGPPWTVGRITLGGTEEVPSVLQAFDLSSGAAYKPAVVAEHVERLEDRLRAEGYLEVNGIAETVLRPEQRQVDVHVLVQAGPRSVISDVIVEGADPSSSLVARALQLSPGQAVSPEAMAETRRRFYDTGLFRSVDIEVEPASPVEGPGASALGAERPVVARIRVQERPNYRFRYGLVLSDEVISAEERDLGLGAALDLERRNLFQRAITAGLSGRFRRDQQIGRAFVGAERFFGLPLGSTLFLSRERESSTAIVESNSVTTIGDVTEISVEQGYRPGRFTELRYGYGFGRNRTRIEGEGQDFDLSVRVARMTGSALVDRRRDPFNPTGGWFASGSLELSKEGLGSDISFLKSFLQYFQFVDLGRSLVFGSTVRLGLAAPIDENDVLIPSEQFFAGGATTVRGYREDDLGPRSIFGDAEGGNAMLVLNEEVRFPLRGRLGGVGFVDVGNVFPTVSEIDLGSLQVGAGGGLRYDSPIGILRLDFAVPVNPREFDRKWTVYFGLGQAF
jgi:outer membrane protein assembly factor BamA